MGVFGVRIEVWEVRGEEREEDERTLVGQESEEVGWMEERRGAREGEGRRGVKRAVEKAGAWWRKTWESNKAVAEAGGFL